LLREIPCSKANRELRHNWLNGLKDLDAAISIFAQDRRKFPVSRLKTPRDERRFPDKPTPACWQMLNLSTAQCPSLIAPYDVANFSPAPRWPPSAGLRGVRHSETGPISLGIFGA
jgi:hypothetical protein